jgi:hypothetical protein
MGPHDLLEGVGLHEPPGGTSSGIVDEKAGEKKASAVP